MNKEKILNIVKNAVSVIVIIAMFVIIFYQNRDRDIFKFGREESSKHITSSLDSGEEFTSGDISGMDGKVAVLTTTSFSVLDEKAQGGKVRMACQRPMLHTEEEYAACYDTDSDEITVFKNSAEIYSVKVENKILRAKVNGNGYLFAATEKEGYNCECMVYNRSGEAIFKWDVSKSEFIDGDINGRNNKIVLSLSAAKNEMLIGEIEVIDITDAKIINKESFNKQLFYSVDFNSNDSFTALGSNKLSYFNSDGSEKWSYEYGDRKLLNANISNHDKMVLAFSEESSIFSGHSSSVNIISRLGKVSAEKVFEGAISDISVSENAVAIAAGKSIYVTDFSLREKKTVDAGYTVKKVELFGDDKHLFVLSSTGGEILK